MSTLRLPSIIGDALAAGLLSTVLLAGTASAQVTPPGTPEGFEHGYEMAGDVRYHFVRGGDAEGEPVILLHGWPTTWYLRHKMMPDLADEPPRLSRRRCRLTFYAAMAVFSSWPWKRASASADGMCPMGLRSRRWLNQWALCRRRHRAQRPWVRRGRPGWVSAAPS